MSLSKLLPTIIILLLTGSATVFSQTEIIDPGARQICTSVKDVEPPAADRQTAAEEKSLANCSSIDLYFGFGQPGDPVKARKCAYAETGRGEKSLVRGKSVLMMVYANARGVPRNFDVALKMACTIGGAPGPPVWVRVAVMVLLVRLRPVDTPRLVKPIQPVALRLTVSPGA